MPTENFKLNACKLGSVNIFSMDSVVSRLLSGDTEKLQEVHMSLLDALHALYYGQGGTIPLPADLGRGFTKHLSIQTDVGSSFHHN